MSLRAMPMIVLNMGSEMLYILNQRLHAQQIAEVKRTKVLVDVVKTMFASSFVTALFQEQAVYSTADVRSIFDRLAHSSIMRLNKKSMSKLYDLMLMGFKRQVLSCIQPADLISVLLNHLETVEELVKAVPDVQLVRSAIAEAKSFYGSLSLEELFMLRSTLLDFYQDYRIRISILLRNNTQLGNGQLRITPIGPVPQGAIVPGKIQHFDADGNVTSSKTVKVIDSERHSEFITSDPMHRTRKCKLGLNIYMDTREATDAAARSTAAPISDTQKENKTDNGEAGDELEEARMDVSKGNTRSQLVHILDSSVQPSASPGKAGISLNFNDFFIKDDEISADGNTHVTGGHITTNIVQLDHSKRASMHKTDLEAKLAMDEGQKVDGEAKTGNISSDNNTGEGDADDDLLSMMDSAGV